MKIHTSQSDSFMDVLKSIIWRWNLLFWWSQPISKCLMLAWWAQTNQPSSLECVLSTSLWNWIWGRGGGRGRGQISNPTMMMLLYVSGWVVSWHLFVFIAACKLEQLVLSQEILFVTAMSILGCSIPTNDITQLSTCTLTLTWPGKKDEADDADEDVSEQ